MKKIAPSTHLALLHGFNHLMLIPAVMFGNLWWLLGALAMWFCVATLGISIGFHRNLSHKSFNCPQWFETFTTVLGCLGTTGSPIGWVGVHKMHHVESDCETDPHSPHIKGFWRSYMHRWDVTKVPRKYVKGLFKKPYLKCIHRNYFRMLYLWMAFLLLIDPMAFVFLYSLVSVIAFHAFGSVNALSHMYGYTNFETGDEARNNWYANVMTAFSGEGWHNNHHGVPGSHRFGNVTGDRPWEIDAGAWIVEKLGYAKQRYLPAS